MEKIQAAIAKARETRHATAPTTRSVIGRRSASAPPKNLSVQQAWDALAVIEPDERVLQRNRIVTIERGREATEFDKLRTRMLQQMQARNWRRVAITSPGPASGKSTITLNLGFSFARQPSMRAMINEIDLRRPSLARLLGSPARYDFARVLQGKDPFSAHAVRPRENLAIAMANQFVENSAELLQDGAASTALDDIQAEYDPTIMLFDMPPFKVSDDTLGFVDNVDCVLIIAASEMTTIEDIDVCERELSDRTEVLGVVLNKCRYNDLDTSYDYYS